MIHKFRMFLCTLKHDIKPKSIIKAKNHSYHFKHLICKDSLLSCHIDIEAMINAFLKTFYLNIKNHYKSKIPLYLH